MLKAINQHKDQRGVYGGKAKRVKLRKQEITRAIAQALGVTNTIFKNVQRKKATTGVLTA